MLNTKRILRLITYSIIAITPTAISVYYPISFSTKFPPGYLLIIGSVLLIFVNKKIKYQREHRVLWGYLAINTLFFIVSYIKYWGASQDIFVEQLLKQFIVMVFAYYLTWFIYRILIITKISLDRLMIVFTLGTFLTSIMVLYVYFRYGIILGVGEAYQYRDIVYGAIRDIDYGQVNFNKLGFGAKIIFALNKGIGPTVSYGPLLSMCISMVVGYSIFSKNTSIAAKVFLVITSIIGATAILTTVSRSAIVGTAISIIILPYIIAHLTRNYDIASRIVKFTSLGILAVLPIVFYFENIVLLVSSSLSRLSFEDLIINPRVNLWGDALRLIFMNPFGYGYEYLRYINYFEGGVFQGGIQINYNHFHNFYIVNLFEFGLVGFMAFLLFMFVILRSSWRNIVKFKNSKLSGISVGSFIALVSAAIHFLFATTIMRSDTVYTGTFFIIVAVVLYIKSRYTPIASENKLQ